MVRLAVRDLAFDYPGGVRAVCGLDLEVASGELVCVIGPNGAGKSTLVKLAAGLVAPRTGRVTIDGCSVADLSMRERARTVAVVPQSLRTVPEVLVEHFAMGGRYGRLDFWRRHSAEDRDAVRRALAEADVSDLGGRLLTELSGGQRQRVMIARALAQAASVLLVDEPTSSLDPEHQLSIFSLVARLSGEGRAVLVVTHDLNLASQFATRIALMQEGRIVAEGAPKDVLRPEVLCPVYGEQLRFGTWPGPNGDGERPFVVPWVAGD